MTAKMTSFWKFNKKGVKMDNDQANEKIIVDLESQIEELNSQISDLKGESEDLTNRIDKIKDIADTANRDLDEIADI